MSTSFCRRLACNGQVSHPGESKTFNLITMSKLREGGGLVNNLARWRLNNCCHSSIKAHLPTWLLTAFLESQSIAVQTHAKPTSMAHPVYIENSSSTGVAHLPYPTHCALVRDGSYNGNMSGIFSFKTYKAAITFPLTLFNINAFNL